MRYIIGLFIYTAILSWMFRVNATIALVMLVVTFIYAISEG